MIMKVLGQFLFASLMVQMLPSDASFYEWQAGVQTASAFSGIVSEDMLDSFDLLPLSEVRPTIKTPTKKDVNSYGVVTSARSALVVDSKSGMTLYEKDANQVRSIGSVTKLLTMLVFLDTNPNLEEVVMLDPAVDLVQGGRVYLAFYDGLRLKDVLGATVVGSDNTAAHSLIRFSGLEQEVFIKKMNEKAQELGMKDSLFFDPTGIDSRNVSTAEDLVLLLKEVKKNKTLRDFMQTETLQITQQDGRVITIKNTNKLLGSYLNEGMYKITAGKTGYLPLAGYVLLTSVEKNGNEIITVVMGSASKDDRIKDAKGLSAWAFKTYSWE